MSAINIVRSWIPELVDPTHVARFWKASGTNFESGDFGTYDIDVYDDEGTSIFSESGTSVSASDPVFDSLQTDGYWGDKDSTGYNFRHTITQATDLSGNEYQGGRRYTVIYTMNSTSDGKVPLVFEDNVVAVIPA